LREFQRDKYQAEKQILWKQKLEITRGFRKGLGNILIGAKGDLMMIHFLCMYITILPQSSKIMNTEEIEKWENIAERQSNLPVGIRDICTSSLHHASLLESGLRSSRLSHFIRNPTGIHRIPPLSSLTSE